MRMLPEIPGVKAAVFTQRIAADNESFSPIGEKCGDSIGVIWHQGEYAPKYVKTLTVWMDNCGPQNKNWTIFPGLISIVNSKRNNLQAITMKFFEVGHTYMSADSFHHRVEKEVKQQGYLYDFGDYEKCINAAGRALVMEPKDFLLWEKQLSQGKISKQTRPLLDDVVVTQFRRGSKCLFFKRSHAATEFESSDCMKKQFKDDVDRGDVVPPVAEYEGVEKKRKSKIIENLLDMMPEDRRSFWYDL